MAEKRQVGCWNMQPATPSRYVSPAALLTLLMEGRKKRKNSTQKTSMYLRTGCGVNQLVSAKGEKPSLYYIHRSTFCFVVFVLVYFKCTAVTPPPPKKSGIVTFRRRGFPTNTLTQLPGTKEQTDLEPLSNQINLVIVKLFVFSKTSAWDRPHATTNRKRTKMETLNCDI